MVKKRRRRKAKRRKVQSPTTQRKQLATREASLWDRTSHRLMSHWSEMRDLPERLRHHVLKIRGDVLPEVLIGTEVPPTTAASYMIRYHDRLEKAFADALRGHSWYYWLHLLRRMGPGRPDRSPVTATREHFVVQLAALKYGDEKADDMEIRTGSLPDGTEQVYGTAKEVTADVAFKAWLIHGLAGEYVRANQVARWVWKGARMELSPDLEPIPIPDEQLEFLALLYDKRHQKYSTIGDVAGLLASDGTERVPSEAGLVVLALVPNVWMHELPQEDPFLGSLMDPTGKRGCPNYIPSRLDLQGIIEPLLPFSAEFESVTGLTITRFFSALASIFLRWVELALYSRVHAYGVYQRAWLLFDDPLSQSLDPLVPHVVQVLKKLGEVAHPVDAKAWLRKMFSFALLTGHQRDAIDLWTCSIQGFVYPTELGYLVDYSVVPEYLRCLVRSLVEPSGGIGSLRGKVFERQVDALLSQDVPFAKPWVQFRKLGFSDGSEREVDATRILGSTLFVVECKSSVFPPSDDKGHPATLRKRRESIVDAKISQAHSLAELLASEPDGSNYSIPPQVRWICSLACAPFPEYIPSKSKWYFLTEEIPRMCSPRELVEFLTGFELQSHVGKPYLLSVNR